MYKKCCFPLREICLGDRGRSLTKLTEDNQAGTTFLHENN